MIKKVLALTAVALTAVMLLPDPADAQRRGGGGAGFRAGGFGGGGGGAFRAGGGVRGGGVALRAGSFRAPAPLFGGGGFVRRPVPIYRRHVFRGPRFRVVAPLFIAGGGGCEWLRRRAVITGDPYWWHRYYACRRAYY